ncbi:MAG TPA: hypothetical protein VGF17_26620 [Phytomonospora sp.]
MEFVQADDLGVRTAVIPLRARGVALRFRLYPMVHLGTPDYYARVRADLRDCHMIVAEGVRSRSLSASVLTASYRWSRHNRRLGLVVQDLDLASFEVPVITPDMTGEEWDGHWRRLPLPLRVLVFVLAPLYGLYMALFGSRALIARHLAEDDDEPGDGLDEDPLSRLLGTLRDEKLAACLAGLYEEHADEPITIGVVYGAAHMPPLIRALRKAYGYQPRRGTWFTVFRS